MTPATTASSYSYSYFYYLVALCIVFQLNEFHGGVHACDNDLSQCVFPGSGANALTIAQINKFGGVTRTYSERCGIYNALFTCAGGNCAPSSFYLQYSLTLAASTLLYNKYPGVQVFYGNEPVVLKAATALDEFCPIYGNICGGVCNGTTYTKKKRTASDMYNFITYELGTTKKGQYNYWAYAEMINNCLSNCDCKPVYNDQNVCNSTVTECEAYCSESNCISRKSAVTVAHYQSLTLSNDKSYYYHNYVNSEATCVQLSNCISKIWGDNISPRQITCDNGIVNVSEITPPGGSSAGSVIASIVVILIAALFIY